MIENLSNHCKKNKSAVHIIPFGGCGEFGMNLTAYVIDTKLAVVDCGIMFPDPTKLGIDALYPDVNQAFESFKKVDAYFITHGHEDHVGAIAQILPHWPAPVYASPWTLSIIRRKLDFLGHNISNFEFHVVAPGSRIERIQYSVEWVHLNHSIPQSMGLFFRSNYGNIFHTGDFKIDEASNMEDIADLSRLKELGKEGCDLVLADSTNAHQPGLCPSESIVEDAFKKLFAKQNSNKIIITSFASNLWRIKTAAEACIQSAKLLCLVGRGMQNSLEIAAECGLWDPKYNSVLINEDQAQQTPNEKLILLATGSQGEPNSALTRMVFDDHKSFSVEESDTVVFSSRVIPGNEKSFFNITSRLEKLGAQSIHWKQMPEIHVSGHGYRGDLKILLDCLKPKYFIPLHGSFFHLKKNLEHSEETGIHQENSMIMENGNVVSFSRDEGVSQTGDIEINHVFVDMFSKFSLDYETLRDRLRIGELGVAFITAAIDPYNLQFYSEPHIEIMGLPSPPGETPESWHSKMFGFISEKILENIEAGNLDEIELNELIRRQFRRFLADRYFKKPVVHAKIILIK